VLSIALPRFSAKPFGGRLQVTLLDCRVFYCRRCLRLVLICRRCDRGNQYSPSCAPLARAENLRAANKRYQKTKAGRLNHKVRQEQYRARLQEKVTHQGDSGSAVKRKSASVTVGGGSDIRHERRQELPEPSSRPGHCDFCGCLCICPGRIGPLPRRAHTYRRGPRLPRYEAGRQSRCAAAIAPETHNPAIAAVHAQPTLTREIAYIFTGSRRIGSTLPSDAGSGNETLV
jgi:hypothetical protein